MTKPDVINGIGFLTRALTAKRPPSFNYPTELNESAGREGGAGEAVFERLSDPTIAELKG